MAHTNTQTNKAKRLQPQAQLELLGIGFEVRNAIASDHSIDSICSFDSSDSSDSIESIDSLDSLDSLESIDSTNSIDFINSVVLLFPICQFYGLIIC